MRLHLSPADCRSASARYSNFSQPPAGFPVDPTKWKCSRCRKLLGQFKI